MIFATDQLVSHIAWFQHRVIQDALAEASANYWERRADAYDAARPRRGDFHGHATSAELVVRDATLAEIAQACRNRASVALITIESDSADLATMVMAEVS